MSRTILLAPFLLAACAASPAIGADQGDLAEGSPDAIGVLELVNSAATTEPVLDVDVGLDSRAAKNIVAARPFATIAALDAVPYVGPSALAKLQAYVEAHGLVPDQTVEGVPLSDAQAAAIVAVANEATQSQLDVDAALDSRAAAAIVAARPFADISAVAAAKYVGKAAIEHLRDWAPLFQPPPCYLALADSIDDSASSLDQLLVLATTVDQPAYEVIAVHITGCPAALDPANQPALIAAVQARVPWGYAPDTNVPFHIVPVAAGDSDYASDLGGAANAIQSRVDDGTWVPSSSPDGAALYAQLASLVAALTPGGTAVVDELRIDLEADECSQRAVAVIDLRTLEIRIVHKLSQC